MKKEFLDFLYTQRIVILVGLNKRKEQQTFPEDSCVYEIHQEQIKQYEEKLLQIDGTIEMYLAIHK